MRKFAADSNPHLWQNTKSWWSTMKSRCAEILQFNLEVEGYEADVAYSAEQALRMHPERYSLILLDVMMGEMSGFRMAQLLKADPETARVPVIFCTAKDSEDDTVAGAEHRSRRLHHQTLFGPRSAGPRAQRTAPHVRRTRRIRKHPLRRSGDQTSGAKSARSTARSCNSPRRSSKSWLCCSRTGA